MAPSASETKMNLSALQLVDPNINEIVESATQVAMFQYSPQTGSWSKTAVEGALFVYALRNPHQRGIIILNRLSPNNYQEPITADIEFKLNVPFLIYKNGSGNIFGAWFYVRGECQRVGSLCCKMVSYLKKRTNSNRINNNNSSATSINPAAASSNINNNKNSGSNNKTSRSILLEDLLPPMASANSKTTNSAGAKDIMSLLAKAGGEGRSDNNVSPHSHSQPQSNSKSQPPQQQQQQKKQPLANSNNMNTNSNNSVSNRKRERRSENGQQNSSGAITGQGSMLPSTPGVPVVHKPIPTRALPPSVEQLFKSVGGNNGKAKTNHNNGSNNNTPLKVSSAGINGNSATAASVNPLEAFLMAANGNRSGNRSGSGSMSGGSINGAMTGAQSPSRISQLSSTPPMTDCMAELISKLNCSAQKVIAEQKHQQQQLQQQQRMSQSPPLIIQSLFSGSAATAGSAAARPMTAGVVGCGQQAVAAFEQLQHLHTTPSAAQFSRTQQPRKAVTLITPEMLEESLSTPPPSAAPGHTVQNDIPHKCATVKSPAAGPLSKVELRSALVHLLENDDDFLSKIHNAYLQQQQHQQQQHLAQNQEQQEQQQTSNSNSASTRITSRRKLIQA